MGALANAMPDGLALGALVALDSVLPVVPSEAFVVAAAALDGSRAPALLLVAAAGAFVGDLLVHLAGRRAWNTRLGRWLQRRRAVASHGWLGAGASALVWGRFVPGGRTCVSFVSGATRVRWRVYLPCALGGSLLWASYVTALGQVGGRAGLGFPASMATGVGLGLLVGGAASAWASRRRHEPAQLSGSSSTPSPATSGSSGSGVTRTSVIDRSSTALTVNRHGP
jgi:membrane-associated protein